jgi:hypothetical protein
VTTRTVVDPTTGETVELHTTRPADTHNPADVAACHEAIARYCIALDTALPEMETLTVLAAETEADWLYARASALIALADRDVDKAKTDRMTVGEREARADVAAHTEHRLYLLAGLRLRTQREYLHSVRAQLSAAQTIARALGDIT